jgi:isoleucyl-tRNA synthetase
MKQIAGEIEGFNQETINGMEASGLYSFKVEGETVDLLLSDVEIITEDIPGWVVSNMGTLTVALDITLTEQLIEEGIARELVNRIQNLRKELNYEVTDKIFVEIEKNVSITLPLNNNYSYICSETLSESIKLVDTIDNENKVEIELTDEIKIFIVVCKL